MSEKAPGMTGHWDRPWGEDDAPGVYPTRMSLTALGDDLVNPVDPPRYGSPSDPDPRIEKLARRLCESEGTQPDLLVMEQISPFGPKGLLIAPRPTALHYAWEVYRREAIAALEMFDAGELNKPG
jgi:hypothetical protein